MAKKKRGRRLSRTQKKSRLHQNVRTPSRGLLPPTPTAFLHKLVPPRVLLQRVINRATAEPIVARIPDRARTIYRDRHLYKINPENFCRRLNPSRKPETSKSGGTRRRSFFYIRALRILSHCRR